MIAMIPGSFDPITIGHVNMIRRCAEKFDKVYVVISNNADKTYLIPLEKRRQLVSEACEDMLNVIVVPNISKMTYEMFDCLRVDIIVKGVRDEVDYKYELEQALYNKKMNGRIETLLLPAADCYKSISSTKIRELLKKDEKIHDLVPPSTETYLLRRKKEGTL